MTTTKRTNSTAFDLEPNPFEQSFSRTSSSSKNVHDKNGPDNKPSTVAIDADSEQDKLNNNSSNIDVDKDNHQRRDVSDKNDDSPKPTLPPLAAIASPGAQPYNNWGLTSTAIQNSNSLRSGPLSPAMLSGPTQPMDHTTFRTGLTPGTGLTPLVAGSANFPPPSPNTAAFLAMVANGGSNALPTPNTLAAITSGANGTNTTNGSSHFSSSSHNNNGNAQTSAASAAAAAANGLFLLSQAHQELTKREEAQARAGLGKDGENIGIEPSVINRRGSKRKVEETPPPPPPAKGPAKRTKSTQNNRKKRGSTISEDEFDDEETSPTSVNGMNSLTTKSTKDMTDEEKRKNFLERNRQAALKCRQRKKAWLTQLQAKVEFLTAENERLTTALVSSREEISRLNALVGAHPPGGHLQSSHGNNSSTAGGHGPAQQPVSVAVSLPAGGKVGGSSRGYGY